MTVITMNGQWGSGVLEVGAQVARQLNYDYVDRIILAQAADRLGASVETLIEKDQRLLTLGERLARFMQRLMEHSASSSGGDPYFGPGLGILLGQDYLEAVAAPSTQAEKLVDQHFIEATRDVIIDLSKGGNVVIIGRASNLILKDHPSAFHVGLISSNMESRIGVIVKREGVSRTEAEKSIMEHQRAWETYYKKFFNAETIDPANFHVILNTSQIEQDQVANIIINAASA